MIVDKAERTERKINLINRLANQLDILGYLNNAFKISHDVNIVSGTPEIYVFEPKEPYYKRYELDLIGAASAVSKLIMAYKVEKVGTLKGFVESLEIVDTLASGNGAISDFEFNYCLLMSVHKINQWKIENIEAELEQMSRTKRY